MTDPKMKVLVVRLEPAEQEVAKAAAAEQDTSMMRLFADLVTQYAAGPLPPPRPAALPQSQMKETRVPLPEKVLARAKVRASREGRNLSDVVFDMAKAAREVAAAG